MSHTYLLDLYEEIETRRQRLQTGDQPQSQDHIRGQMEFLEEFKNLLASRYNSKLPRRIRKKYMP